MRIRCNLCGSEAFGGFTGRHENRCRQCGSNVRARFLGAVMAHALKQHAVPMSELRMLSVAATPHFETYLSGFKVAEHRAMVDSQDGSVLLDGGLRNEEDGGYDLIVHDHFLSRLQRPYEDAIREFDRLLSPGGLIFFTVPIGDGRYVASSEPDALKKGQCHRFGREDLSTTLGRFYPVPTELRLESLLSGRALMSAYIPPSTWPRFTSDTPFGFRKKKPASGYEWILG